MMTRKSLKMYMFYYRINVAMTMPGGEAKMARHRRRKKKSGLKKFFSFIMALVVIAAVIGGGGVLFMKNKLDRLSHVDIDESALAAGDSLDNYRNIVILGVDTRDMTKFEGSRTDSIIIVSLNKKTNELNLISVYRDSLLDIEDVGLDKVTHAFAYGGPERTINTLNRNLDLNITEFAALNFRTVQTIVDDVGGIDVDVAEDEIEQMNYYLPGTARYLGCEYTLIDHAGIQHLDGVQAVTYSRIRHTEGGDYKRTERMRTVLTAVFEQAKTMSISELSALMDDVMPEISTNMTASDIIPLMFRLPSMEICGSTGWPYDKEAYISPYTGVWYAAPVTLRSNVERLHTELFGEADYVLPEGTGIISDNISYTTGYYGN